MLIRGQHFQAVGGFDDDFFLYLEDADITRKLRALGRCIHLPIASITHDWGKGNYKDLRLVLVNIHSAWVYFRKWGLRIW
jgi:GT2 family glycosyltransferase